MVKISWTTESYGTGGVPQRWTRRSLASNPPGPYCPRKTTRNREQPPNRSVVEPWGGLLQKPGLQALSLGRTAAKSWQRPSSCTEHHLRNCALDLDSKRQALKAKTRIHEWENKSAIRIRKNPKPVEAEAGVERQRGWAPASQGAFSTSAPPH